MTISFIDSTWKNKSLTEDGIIIPHISLVELSHSGKEWTHGKELVWRHYPVPGREEQLQRDVVLEYMNDRIPHILTQAQGRGQTITNGKRVDMLGVFPYGNRYVFNTGESNYFEFLSIANRLDDPSPQGRLREIFSLNGRNIQTVSEIPFVASVGTGTVIVTADKKIVAGVRGNTAVAPGSEREAEKARIHFTGEGMSVKDVQGDIFPPLSCARRGVKEEYNLDEDDILRICSTGFFFDHKRYQPVFSHTAHVKLTFDELVERQKTARDSWENTVLIAFDNSPAILQDVLRDQYPRVEFASTHAHASLWCTFAFLHGGEG